MKNLYMTPEILINQLIFDESIADNDVGTSFHNQWGGETSETDNW